MKLRELQPDPARLFLETLAGYSGYYLQYEHRDERAWQLQKRYGITADGEYLTDGRVVMLYVLAADSADVSRETDDLYVSVESGVYNRIVELARESSYYVPVVLVVVVSENDCFRVDEEQAVLRQQGYWWHVRPQSKPLRDAKAPLTLEIPKAQKITASFCADIFSKFD